VGGALGVGPGRAGRLEAVGLYEKTYKKRRERRKVAGVVRKIVQKHGSDGWKSLSCTKKRTKSVGRGGKSLVLYEKSYNATDRWTFSGAKHE
jgi:hypothetical protein